jgi:hypothetical protein
MVVHVGFGKTNCFYENLHVGFGKTNCFYENLHVGFGKTSCFYENLHVGFGKTSCFYENLHVSFNKNKLVHGLRRTAFLIKQNTLATYGKADDRSVWRDPSAGIYQSFHFTVLARAQYKSKHFSSISIFERLGLFD